MGSNHVFHTPFESFSASMRPFGGSAVDSARTIDTSINSLHSLRGLDVATSFMKGPTATWHGNAIDERRAGIARRGRDVEVRERTFGEQARVELRARCELAAEAHSFAGDQTRAETLLELAIDALDADADERRYLPTRLNHFNDSGMSATVYAITAIVATQSARSRGLTLSSVSAGVW